MTRRLYLMFRILLAIVSLTLTTVGAVGPVYRSFCMSGTQQANIVGNFHEADCQGIQRTTGLDYVVESALGLEVVTCFVHGDTVYL